MSAYARFTAMIVTAVVVMYGVMYLNTYSLDHVYWSETRVYMAFLMGATMAVVMLFFMLHMYTKPAANITVLLAAVAIFAAALHLVRSQRTIEDESWMRAMIPHHSIAILTSERAELSDPRVRELADQIIESQRREIAEMKSLLRDLADREQN